MIRGRLPDEVATYPDATKGVNLRKSPEDLEPGEAELMQNCLWDSDIRKRFGCARWTTISFGMQNALGGHKAYFGDGTGIRLAAFGTNLMKVNDSGTFSTLTSTLSSGHNTYFTDWSITDRSYMSNGTDEMRYLDSTGLVATLSGTNIPASPGMVVPFADRLFAIQGSVVIATDPRTDTVWASTGSAWSAYRGIGGSGNPTAITVHSSSTLFGDPQSQLLIFQRNTVTALQGTNFGSSVTVGSPPTGWDATLTLLDPRIGTSSPYSVCHVPGIGTFWVTSERNVAWLPLGTSVPRIIGNSLYSYRAGIPGLNDITQSQLSQVLMIYHQFRLKLYLPVSGQSYSTVQYWLDLRPLMENMASAVTPPSEEFPANWSGPHTGQSIGRVWLENQSNDPERLMGMEGNPSNGLMVYEVNPTNYFKDDVGPDLTPGVSNDIAFHYKSFYHDFGAPGYDKYLYDLLIDSQGYINFATVTVNDLHATLTSGLSILKLNGDAFTNITYGSGVRYGNGTLYGQASANNWGHVNYVARTGVAPAGDALQVDVQETAGNNYAISTIRAQAKIQKVQPIV